MGQSKEDDAFFRALHGIPKDAVPRLPLRGDANHSDQAPAPQRSTQRTHQKIIIAGHLILTGYAHWLPNDPRGSGSDSLRNEALEDLGEIHHGRKRHQPSRGEIREFYRHAEPLLQHQTIWFDPAKRQAIAESFARTVETIGYTVWACAILRNHAHLVVRRHRDPLENIWSNFAIDAASQLKLRFPLIASDHPIWAHRPYVVYAYSSDDVRRQIRYVQDNPPKERLPQQAYSFVLPYDGWPGTKSRTDL